MKCVRRIKQFVAVALLLTLPIVTARSTILRTGMTMGWYDPISTDTYHVNDAVPFHHLLYCTAKRQAGSSGTETIVVYFINGYDSTVVDTEFDGTSWTGTDIDERPFQGEPNDTHAFGSTGSHGSWAKITYDIGAGEVLWSVNFNAFWSDNFTIVP